MCISPYVITEKQHYHNNIKGRVCIIAASQQGPGQTNINCHFLYKPNRDTFSLRLEK